jgi:CheY-like chemotaxis protein
MDRITMERIFDPFFTTKERSRGTGLGLASVYSIVNGHHGYIDVDSSPGKGTKFNVYLPASEEKVQPVVESPQETVEGDGTILLVDDEDMILEVGTEMLGRLGYSVLEARDGKEALEIYQERKADIDLVILDMVMPHMSGGEAYYRLKEINEHVKVLVSTGRSIEGEPSELLERGCNGLIQKPYNLKELSSKIKDAMHSAQIG